MTSALVQAVLLSNGAAVEASVKGNLGPSGTD